MKLRKKKVKYAGYRRTSPLYSALSPWFLLPHSSKSESDIKSNQILNLNRKNEILNQIKGVFSFP
jgi:hypothetical protein